MRLWHKNLISVLPRQQLLAQWRELCCIAKNIAVNGTPNHLLVNKVLEYSDEDFFLYANIVLNEMKKREYFVSDTAWMKFYNNVTKGKDYFKPFEEVDHSFLYKDWHNDRYLWQCYHNLQEKYDCGGITEEEWFEVQKRMEGLLGMDYEEKRI